MENIFRHEINALNLEDEVYLAAFEKDPPRHLGVAAYLVHPESTAQEQQVEWLVLVHSFCAFIQELFEFDEARKEFLSLGIGRVTVSSSFTGFPDDIWGHFPAALQAWCHDGAAIVIAFFDAEREVDGDQKTGLLAAMLSVDDRTIDADSPEPAAHSPLPSPPTRRMHTVKWSAKYSRMVACGVVHCSVCDTY